MDIADYSRRRAQLVGRALLDNAGPADRVAEQLKNVYFQPLDTVKAEVEARGDSFVSFANYDYLGLGADPRVRRSVCDAAMTYGVGAEASRLVGGERSIHQALEREIATFIGVEDCLTLVSGYLTNVALVGHLLTSNDLIVTDELAHNSILLGAQGSRATMLRFAHNDLGDLDAILARERARYKRVLIIVEGLYSMDGDRPDLPRLMELRNRYGAWLLVDEAHSIGVLGRTGRGITEHYGVDPNDIELIVGTLSKSFAGCGGFIAARRPVIDWLRFTLPAFVYSVGISPVIAAAVRKALAILQREPGRVARVQENSQLFRREAARRGLDTGSAIGAGVISILFPHAAACMRASQALFEAGYFAPPIPVMAVPTHLPRIRFFVSANHTPAQITGMLDILGTLTRQEDAEVAGQPGCGGAGLATSEHLSAAS